MQVEPDICCADIPCRGHDKDVGMFLSASTFLSAANARACGGNAELAIAIPRFGQERVAGYKMRLTPSETVDDARAWLTVNFPNGLSKESLWFADRRDPVHARRPFSGLQIVSIRAGSRLN